MYTSINPCIGCGFGTKNPVTKRYSSRFRITSGKKNEKDEYGTTPKELRPAITNDVSVKVLVIGGIDVTTLDKYSYSMLVIYLINCGNKLVFYLPSQLRHDGIWFPAIGIWSSELPYSIGIQLI